MALSADVFVLNKVDLLPRLHVNGVQTFAHVPAVNSKLLPVALASENGPDLNPWYERLRGLLLEVRNRA